MKNQKIYLEHANLTVNDINESVEFFQTAFPHFTVRGGDIDLREWIHLGDESTYIAINVSEQKIKTENYRTESLQYRERKALPFTGQF